MRNLRRKNMIWIMLGLYWPMLFIVSHIPIPQVVRQAEVSDKMLHFVAYFILIFLVWGAVKPYEKVNWHKTTPWWVLVFVVWYGAVDEWLQGFVRGRTVDIHDFYVDLVAAVASLILLTFLTFWPAFLVVTAGVIMGVSVGSQVDLNQLMPWANLLFHVFAYAFFTGLWVVFLAKGCRDKRQATDSLLWYVGPHKVGVWKWGLRALIVPILLLLVMKLGTLWQGKSLVWIEIIGAVVTIGAVLGIAIQWSQKQPGSAQVKRGG